MPPGPQASPVHSLLVTPYYGQRQAMVSWEPDPSIGSGWDVYVFRSLDNGFQWDVLNEDSPVRGPVWYLDETLPDDLHRLKDPLYRLLWVRGEDKRPTNPVGPFSRLTRAEYGLVGANLRREYLDMSRGNGIPVWHTTPLTAGTPAAGYDEDTGQLTTAPCRNDDAYGQPYKGGFAPPMQTWIREVSEGSMTSTLDPEGTGEKVAHPSLFRFLAWPRPRTGDLVISPDTGERWLVGEKVNPFKLRGVAPLAWEAMVLLLPRNDPRQRFPVPDMQIDGQMQLHMNR